MLLLCMYVWACPPGPDAPLDMVAALYSLELRAMDFRFPSVSRHRTLAAARDNPSAEADAIDAPADRGSSAHAETKPLTVGAVTVAHAAGAFATEAFSILPRPSQPFLVDTSTSCNHPFSEQAMDAAVEDVYADEDVGGEANAGSSRRRRLMQSLWPAAKWDDAAALCRSRVVGSWLPTITGAHAPGVQSVLEVGHIPLTCTCACF